MLWRDIATGEPVYHSLFTHRGKGVVVGIKKAVRNTRSRRVLVRWPEYSNIRTEEMLWSLRKTPNKKRIKEMVLEYKKRGKPAKDGGDRLILPKEW